MLPDFDMQQADQENVDALMDLLENEKKVNDGLVNIIFLQDDMIAKMRTRMREHGLAVLEKSIVETTREELAQINKSIPKSLTQRAKNPDAMKRNYHKEQADATYRAHEAHGEAMISLLDSITNGVDLEKHGIDPITLHFKPGWGPDGRLTRWERIKVWFLQIFK